MLVSVVLADAEWRAWQLLARMLFVIVAYYLVVVLQQDEEGFLELLLVKVAVVDV